MEKSEWEQLDALCRKALDEIPAEKQEHEIPDAVRLTGAFASSVLAHWDVSHEPPDGGHDEAEYQRGITDTQAAQERGPAGSPEREQGYRDMEEQWRREGFDG